MSRPLALASLLCVLALVSAAQSPPGIRVHDGHYGRTDGFLGFAPADGHPADTLALVVFVHGYGGINPLNYGAWLRHLVEEGAAVVYPRYQRNLWRPRSKKFAANVAEAVRAGRAWAATLAQPVDTSRVVYVGHSYGGAIAAYLMAREEQLDLPRAYGALLAAPGTSRLSGSRLDDYGDVDPEARVVIVSHEGDYVVGDEFPELLYETLPASAKTAWYRQATDAHPDTALGLALGQNHNEAYALDPGFDTGYRNYTTRKALRIGRTDAIDTLLYWPLATELVRGLRGRARADYSLAAELDMGTWPDGTPRRRLPVVRREPLAPAESPGPPPTRDRPPR